MSNRRISAIVAAAALTSFLVGCGPQQPPAQQVAIIDLSVIARETGQDVVIRERAEEGIAELNNQLQQLAASLDEQLAAERERIGVAPNEEQAERLQQLAAQARQQVNQAQVQAQQQANDFEQQLVAEFRDELMPMAEVIAAERGISLILSKDVFIFWAEDAIDITDDVVTAWQAQAPQAAAVEPEPVPEAAAEPAVAEPQPEVVAPETAEEPAAE